MKKIDWKDVGKRAGKTFVQAFIATVSVEPLGRITDIETAKGVIRSMLIAGVAAGVSAVWNMVTGYTTKNKEV